MVAFCCPKLCGFLGGLSMEHPLLVQRSSGSVLPGLTPWTPSTPCWHRQPKRAKLSCSSPLWPADWHPSTFPATPSTGIMLRLALSLGRPGAVATTAAARRLLPGAAAGARRAAAAAGFGSVPTGPAGGYNDPEECSIADESERQLQEDRRAAERLAAQVRGDHLGGDGRPGRQLRLREPMRHGTSEARNSTAEYPLLYPCIQLDSHLDARWGEVARPPAAACHCRRAAQASCLQARWRQRWRGSRGRPRR